MSDTVPSTPVEPTTTPHDQQQANGSAAEPKSEPKDGRRDFAEIMQRRYQTAHRTQRLGALLIPIALLLLGAGLGALIRALASPAVGTVLTVSAAAVLMAVIVAVTVTSYRMGPDPRIDWSTASPYEARLTANLPGDVRHLLLSAQARIQRHRPAALDAYLFSPGIRDEHTRICTLDSGCGCSCWAVRINACVAAARSHPVLVVGDRLLAHPDALAFVLAHEVHHVRRPWLHLRLALSLPTLLGWLPLGLALPVRHLLMIAPALWLATMMLRWIDEIAADVCAARTTGPGTAQAWWELYRASQPVPPRWLRLIQPVVKALAPTHPPVALRTWLAARIQPDGQA